MNICAIAAVAKNGVIGKDGELPWHYPNDLKHFRSTTINHPIIMGRKTFDSFPNPLPDRTHIVLTKNKELEHSNDSVYYVHTVDDALNIAESVEKDTVYIIGGRTIYDLFFDYLDELILTEINEEYNGDTYFPEFNAEQWNSISLDKYNDNYNIVLYYKDK